MFGRLAGRGHQVDLLVSGFEGAAPRERLDGMDVHRVGGRHTFSLAAPRYYRRHLAGRADVLIEDLNKVPLFSPFWSREPLVLLVHHLFGGTAFQEASVPVAAATWLLERPLGAVYRGSPTVAVSESTKQDLVARGLHGTDIEVIPNGVDLDLFSAGGERAAEPTVLYLGRLKRYKRVDLVLRSCAILRDRGIDFRLVLAGTGDDEDRLRGIVAELDLQDRVAMPGFVSEEEKLRLFRSAWVHVFTSPKEGWGISNLEAAACGTPTVASDSPGLRESVVDGRTGFLVPHGDTTAVADRIQSVLLDPSLRDRLGRQARAFAERFSWDAAADRMERYLHALPTVGSAAPLPSHPSSREVR